MGYPGLILLCLVSDKPELQEKFRPIFTEKLFILMAWKMGGEKLEWGWLRFCKKLWINSVDHQDTFLYNFEGRWGCERQVASLA